MVFRRNWPDCKTLLAAGAGASLATAFNAPIAGAVFVLEELVRRFDTRMTMTTLGASAGAIAVARVLLGEAPDFHVEPLPYPGFGTVPIYLALGLVAGFLGVAYNRTILSTLAAAERLYRWPVELRAALIGAAGAAMRSHSARWPEPRRLCRSHVSSFSVSSLGQCPTRRGHPEGCLRRCLSWGLRAASSWEPSATAGSPASLPIQRLSPWLGWRRSSLPLYGRR